MIAFKIHVPDYIEQLINIFETKLQYRVRLSKIVFKKATIDFFHGETNGEFLGESPMCNPHTCIKI